MLLTFFPWWQWWKSCKSLLLVSLQTLELKNYEDLRQHPKLPAPGRDSVVAVGRGAPDPMNDVRIDRGALAVPMGRVGPNPRCGGWRDRGHYSSYNGGMGAHNEFVTFSDTQTAIR